MAQAVRFIQVDKKALMLSSIFLGIVVLLFYYMTEQRGSGIIFIESNLDNYRVIPEDRGGVKSLCVELDLEICEGLN